MASTTGRSLLIVPGVGPENPIGVVVGEAPGAEEARLGLPFVGASGKLLNEALVAAGIDRDKLYVTNTYKVYKPGNPTPTQDEIDYARKALKEEVDKGVPILALGTVATKALLGRGISEIKMMGRVSIREEKWPHTPIIPTWHPAATMYDKKKRPEFFEDVARFGEVINGS